VDEEHATSTLQLITILHESTPPCSGLVEMDTSKREDTPREVFHGKDTQAVHSRI
jgi:hypothetical protein